MVTDYRLQITTPDYIMGLIYYIFEYPLAGRLLFKGICISFTITTMCRRASGREGWMFRRGESLFAN